MKKRIFAMFLALSLALGTLPLTVLAAEYTASLNGGIVTVDTTAKTVKDESDQDVTDYYFIFADSDTVSYYQGADGSSPTALQLKQLYTVTFNNNDGTQTTSTVKGNADKPVAQPAAPTRENYTFSKWTATNSADADAVAFPYTPAGNVTLYAQWTANAAGSVTVTFDPNYVGAETIEVTAKEDGTVEVPTVTRENFTLEGWYTKDGKTQNADGSADWGVEAPSTFTEDTTLYAKWTAAEGTVEITATESEGKIDVSTAPEVTEGTENLVVAVETEKTALELTVSAEIMQKVSVSVTLQTESIEISVPVEAASKNSGRLEVKIDTQTKPTGGAAAVTTAAAVKVEITGITQDTRLKTPITFSLSLDPKVTLVNPVVAYWNTVRNAYVRSRGGVKDGKASFSTRHLTEFAVISASEVQQEELEVAVKGGGQNAGVDVLAEAGESVLAGYNFTYKDQSAGTMGATLGGSGLDEESGLTKFAGSMSAPAGGNIQAKTVLAGTGAFQWDNEKGFTFDPANLIAAYGQADAAE